MKYYTVAVLSDLNDDTPSSHYSALAAYDITSALRYKGHEVHHFKVNKDNWEQALQVPGDMVFNLIDDSVPGLYYKVSRGLEKLGRLQLGNDAKTFKSICNKITAKRILMKNDVPTPPFEIITSVNHKIKNLTYPVIVKPSESHSSIGIGQKSVVNDQKELHDRIKYLHACSIKKVYIERFIPGREVYVAILNNDGKAHVLPYCEMQFNGDYNNKYRIYTFDAKWNRKSPEWLDNRILCPINLDIETAKKIKKAALKAHRVLHLRDIARIDFRIDKENNVYIIDVNSTPCLNEADLEQELVWIAAKTTNRWMSYDAFVENLVKICCKRSHGKQKL